MPPVLRLLKLAAAGFVLAIGIWFEAVRRTPEVKAAKRLRRRARLR